MIKIHFDGRCEPNPGGVATYGFVVEGITKSAEEGDFRMTLFEGRGLAALPFSADSTNNVAEYMGLIEALRWLTKHNLMSKDINICGDSNLIIKQVQGKYKVKAPRLAALHAEAVALIGSAKIELTWIPREQNSRADALTNAAYADYRRG